MALLLSIERNRMKIEAQRVYVLKCIWLLGTYKHYLVQACTVVRLYVEQLHKELKSQMF